MLAKLNNCHAIFASNHKAVLYLAMTQRHANKGSQQMVEHRLVLSRAHVCSLEQRSGNAYEQNEQTLLKFCLHEPGLPLLTTI